MKTATHIADANCVVKFKVGGSFLGDVQYVVYFSNGEKTTMSEARFFQLFTVNK